MKIFGNIGPVLKLVWSAIKFRRYVPRITAAKASGNIAEEKQAIGDVLEGWVNHVISVYDMRFDVRGRENLPQGPCVYIANHQGYADIMAMLKAIEGRQTGFIAKSEFQKVPLLGSWIRNIRGLFIKRDDPKASLRTIQEGSELIKQGFSMVIFPEGHRSKGPQMSDFKPGSLKLATKAGVPIVPVTIDGTYRMFEEQGKFTCHQSAAVTIHPAIETASIDRAKAKELPDLVYNTIKNGLAPEAASQPSAS